MVLITLQKKAGTNAAVEKLAVTSQPRGGDCREQASPHLPQHPQRSPCRSYKALPSCLGHLAHGNRWLYHGAYWLLY